MTAAFVGRGEESLARVRVEGRFKATRTLEEGLGVLGAGGRGVAGHTGMMDTVDIFTGTLGKALGGSGGGFVAGPRAVIETMAQGARPTGIPSRSPPRARWPRSRGCASSRATPRWPPRCAPRCATSATASRRVWTKQAAVSA